MLRDTNYSTCYGKRLLIQEITVITVIYSTLDLSYSFFKVNYNFQRNSLCPYVHGRKIYLTSWIR